MKSNASGPKLLGKCLSKSLSGTWKAMLALSLCGGIAAAEPKSGVNNDHQTTTAEDFLQVPVPAPVAIGHHGVGPNLGGDPTIPIENTVESVRHAYSLGARVVEVDVQLTRTESWLYFTMTFSATLPALTL